MQMALSMKAGLVFWAQGSNTQMGQELGLLCLHGRRGSQETGDSGSKFIVKSLEGTELEVQAACVSPAAASLMEAVGNWLFFFFSVFIYRGIWPKNKL